MNLKDVLKVMAPLRNRIANLVGRAVLQRADDAKKLQSLQVDVLEGETREDVERFQNYGFTSVPKEGAEAVVLFIGGSRDHGVAIAVDDRRYRIGNLESGEVAIYTDQGDKIVLKRGGTIEVTASTKVVLTTPVVELAGNSNPVAKGDVLNTAITTFANAVVAAFTTLAGANAGTPVLDTVAFGAQGTLSTAATALSTAATAALSTKVKLG